MCLKYIYNLCFKNEYEDIPEEPSTIDKCIQIININEPELVISYSEKGCIIFSKEWDTWRKNISQNLKRFIIPYNQIYIDDILIQVIYFCIIPEEYHKVFLSLLEVEYNL